MGGRETGGIGVDLVGGHIPAPSTDRPVAPPLQHEGGIAVAAPENIAALLASSGICRKVIPWNGSTRERIHALKRGRFRRAVILPNSFRSAMITYAAGIGE